MVFRYFIEHGTQSYRIHPLNGGELNVSWDEIKEDSRRGYTQTFSETLVLGSEDYHLLRQFEKNYFCDSFTIRVEISCSDYVPVFSTFIKRQFYVTDCQFDTFKCLAFVKSHDIDPCANISKTYNLFNAISARRTINITSPNLEIETVTYTSQINFRYDHNYAWGGTGTGQAQRYGVQNHKFVWNNAAQTGDNTTTWAREKLTTSLTYVADASWTLLQTTVTNKIWVRVPNFINCTYETVYSNNGDDFITTDTCETFLDLTRKSGATQIPNAIFLSEALEFFATTLCGVSSVKSDFFQINPVNATNINYVTGEVSKVMHLTINDLSDVKRPNAANKATRLNLSFEKLMAILKGMFNVEWQIEGNALVIEHPSYFTQNVGLDMTALADDFYKYGQNVYTYNQLSVPRSETWQYIAARYNSDFRKNGFDYESCTKTGEAKNTVIECVTDLILCLSNPDIDSGAVTDDGVFIGACGEDNGVLYFLTQAAGFAVSGVSPNNVLGISALLQDYHKHGRPFTVATMNNQTYNFTGVYLKTGEAFSHETTCSDILNFDPRKLVKTNIGEGKIISASFQIQSAVIEYKLKYE